MSEKNKVHFSKENNKVDVELITNIVSQMIKDIKASPNYKPSHVHEVIFVKPEDMEGFDLSPASAKSDQL